MNRPKSLTVCAEPGCPDFAHRRGRCANHQIDTRSPSSRATGRRDWSKVRAQILTRDRYVCRWCGGPADQVDHLDPVSAGGTNDPRRLVAACATCNNRRGNRPTPGDTTPYGVARQPFRGVVPGGGTLPMAFQGGVTGG